VKKFALGVLFALAFGSVAHAVPACSAACDAHWKACKSHCGEGTTAIACKSSCAAQHEECLNGCIKNPQNNMQRKNFAPVDPGKPASQQRGLRGSSSANTDED
jgi:hypothetical protein